MTRRYLLPVMALLLLACSCSKADPDKTVVKPKEVAADVTAGTPIELEPSPDGFPLGLGTSQGFALQLFDTPGPDQGFKKFPPESGSKRHYDQFTLAGKVHLVITEESTPPRFYFDENRNGDLTDDRPPAVGEGPALVPNHYSIHVLYEDEKVVAPYRLWLFGSNMGGVRFYPKCHWHGSLTVNGKPYKVVAFDGNADGDYSNDPVVIDANGNDKAEDEEQLIPGKSITIDGQQVTFISISRSGLTVRFKI